MKTITQSLILLIACVNFLSAQNTAVFETTFYIEDAIGNIDSVILGYDPGAKREFNPFFGEEDIIVPYDSILEVRAVHFGNAFDSGDILSSKKIVEPVYPVINEEFDCFDGPAAWVVFINAKYLPLTISWKRNDFRNYCNAWSHMTTYIDPLAIHDWFEYDQLYRDDSWVCLAKDSFMVTNLQYPMTYPVRRLEEIEGSGTDTVYGLLILKNAFLDWGPQCIDDYTVSSDELLDNAHTINIYPNPFSDYLFLDTGNLDFISVEIYDMTGSKISNSQTNVLQLNHLQDGYYILKINLEHGYISKRLIKI